MNKSNSRRMVWSGDVIEDIEASTLAAPVDDIPFRGEPGDSDNAPDTNGLTLHVDF